VHEDGALFLCDAEIGRLLKSVEDGESFQPGHAAQLLAGKVNATLGYRAQDARANRSVRLGPIALLAVKFGHVPWGFLDAEDGPDAPIFSGFPQEHGIAGGNLVVEAGHGPRDDRIWVGQAVTEVVYLRIALEYPEGHCLSTCRGLSDALFWQCSILYPTEAPKGSQLKQSVARKPTAVRDKGWKGRTASTEVRVPTTGESAGEGSVFLLMPDAPEPAEPDAQAKGWQERVSADLMISASPPFRQGEWCPSNIAPLLSPPDSPS
jgi:hypothetical protein